MQRTVSKHGGSPFIVSDPPLSRYERDRAAVCASACHAQTPNTSQTQHTDNDDKAVRMRLYYIRAARQEENEQAYFTLYFRSGATWYVPLKRCGHVAAA